MMRSGFFPHWRFVSSIGAAALLTLAFATPAQPTEAHKVAAAHGASGQRVLTVSAITLSSPQRGQDLQVRVSAPATGSRLPIVIFSHGNGNSMYGYEPLVHYWASHGFVVIQPTHLDSRLLNVAPEDSRTPLIWRFRVDDIKRILNQLDSVLATVPTLKGRADVTRIAMAGHSYGGITAGMMLGARVIGADGSKEDLSDPRIIAGVLLSTAGAGGNDLSAFAAARFPFMNPSFGELAKPVLVVAGDKDRSPLTTRGSDWFTDPYRLSPGPKCLATLFGGEHLLGGISGYLVTETSDENPARVAAVQELTTAYLRSALHVDDRAWPTAQATFNAQSASMGKVECK